MNTKLLFFIPLSAVFLLTGCVTGRRTVALPVPPGPHAAEKGKIALAVVTDERHFQNKPRDPSIPSISGDVAKLSSEERATFIGRQRNTYGQALGDIAMPKGHSVPQTVRELVTEGFARRGYTITTNSAASDGIDVKVDEFWAWFTPGFAAISFEARVYCTLKLKRGGTESNISVKGYGLNRGQFASDANWQLAYRRAFEDFLAKLDAELVKAGM